jgi:hypothetical protein
MCFNLEVYRVIGYYICSILKLITMEALMNKENKNLDLNHSTIGERLKNTRNFRGMSLSDVNADTKISRNYIYDFDEMPLENIHDGFDFNRIANYIDDYIQMSINFCSKCWALRFWNLLRPV